MAGCCTNISPFKPLLSPSSKSSLQFLTLTNPNSIKTDANRVISNVPLSLIVARYGRPSFNRSRDTRKNTFEIDPAVDISTIRSATVRLIDAEQNMVGVVSKNEAIQRAEDAELDLVILSPDSDPPVVKIMDYNKYKYEQQRKKKEQQKKSLATRMDMKELKMGYNIDVHDYSVRLRAAQKFLNDGDKVKVIVQLKGRENEFRSNAIELIKRFQNDIGELATEESKNFRERNVYIVLLPNKAIQQKAQEPAKKKERTQTNEEKTQTTEVSASL